MFLTGISFICIHVLAIDDVLTKRARFGSCSLSLPCVFILALDRQIQAPKENTFAPRNRGHRPPSRR